LECPAEVINGLQSKEDIQKRAVASIRYGSL
jgi:hypothetical protein